MLPLDFKTKRCHVSLANVSFGNEIGLKKYLPKILLKKRLTN